MGYGAALFLLLAFITTPADSALLAKSFRDCMATTFGSESIETILLTSSSSQYPQALQSFQQNPRWLNSSSSTKPLAILTPLHQSHIQVAILCAKKLGMHLRVRSGGHDYEGLSYLSTYKPPFAFVMIDLNQQRSIDINLADETAWVQAGATLGELYYEISKASGVHGFPAGICPSVGVGGHISGGGFGTMLRKFGTAADHVVDAYLVDANGNILDRKSMGEDLFWAIRGGSATSFGIILAWKIKLVRVPPIVTGFNIQRTLEEGATILINKWQHVADKLHEDLFIRVVAQNRGGGSSSTILASFNSLFLGGKEKLMAMMKEEFPELRLEAKDCIEMSWIQSTVYFAGYRIWEPAQVLLNRITTYKSSFKAKSDFVMDPIPEIGLQGIWNLLLREDAFALLIMDPYGGRMNEISEYEIPFPHRKGNLYNIQYLVKWDDNSIQASNRHVNWMRMLHSYMTPYVSRSPRAAYANYRDLDLGRNRNHHTPNTSYSEASVWGLKYFKGNFKRLAQIKTRVDPHNFFRNEQSIPILN
ncbi:berberine bridge enzyme-like 26 [Arachis hypogaea]|uniref:berberine bridge enzyme-like 26 n=1 Tax=Arachis hypogaea TaxID=3818 RepID=UPI000DECF260|nr:berberine bridge enzyme-like 26 [Arachis hypogaea]